VQYYVSFTSCTHAHYGDSCHFAVVKAFVVLWLVILDVKSLLYGGGGGISWLVHTKHTATFFLAVRNWSGGTVVSPSGVALWAEYW